MLLSIWEHLHASVFLNLLNTAFLNVPPPFSLSVCVYLCVWASDGAVVGFWSDQSVAAVQWVVYARLSTMLDSAGKWQRSSPHPDRAYSSQLVWLFPHARCQKVFTGAATEYAHKLHTRTVAKKSIWKLMLHLHMSLHYKISNHLAFILKKEIYKPTFQIKQFTKRHWLCLK